SSCSVPLPTRRAGRQRVPRAHTRMTETVADPGISGRTTDDYAERRTGLGGGSSADWTTAAGYSSRGGVAIESAAGPINEGAVSTTAVTTPQGLPSHSER